MIKRLLFGLGRRLMPGHKYASLVGVNLGKGNWINTKNFGSEPYLITIGNHCQITHGVYFHTHGGAQVLRRKYTDLDFFGKIVIGDYVYIGTGAQILPGVTIGDGSIVAAGSIVTKSVPENVIVGGNPARIIGDVNSFLEKILPYNVKSKSLSSKEKKKLLLSLEDKYFVHK